MKKLSLLVALMLVACVSCVGNQAQDSLRARQLFEEYENNYALQIEMGSVDKNRALWLTPLKQAYELGSVEAMVELGEFYYAGLGVEKDYARAIQLWREAVDKGSWQAMCNMGMAYLRGNGVESDLEEGLR